MKLIRTLAERLSRGVMLRRHLPADVGGRQLFVSPDSQLKYLKPGPAAFDAELLSIARSWVRPESVVWDIGANVGVFAFAAAGLATNGRTLAVEADPWLADMMRRSSALRSNRELRLDVLSAAVSSRDGVSWLEIARRGRASNSLADVGGRDQKGGTRATLLVPTISLDTLLRHFEPPSFVKIDVEGAEELVLAGANRLLSETRPVLYIEVGNDLRENVSTTLTNAGYRLFDGSRPLDAQEPSHLCYFNTLAMPA